MRLEWGDDRVESVEHVTLNTGPGRWAYGENHRDAIARHWQLATAANPAFFNGVIHLVEGLVVTPGQVRARLLRTDFQSYLYWRDEGFPRSAGVFDGFGSALIRSVEGHVLLGRQRPGNVNAGLAYLPGGFIDARDAGEDGAVDIAASIAREVQEETGLCAGDLAAEPGFLVTRAGPHVSFARPYRSALGAEALAARIARHIAADPEPELADIVIIRRKADMDGLAMPHFARVLLTHLFNGNRPQATPGVM